MNLVRGLFGALDRLSPALAGELAVPLFRRIGPRRPVLHDEAAVLDEAERSTLVVRGTPVVVARWRGGPQTALLVHGWQGRAAQFVPLVRELRAAGYNVVSFDAPGHGASGGRHTDLPQLHEIVHHLARETPPRLVVAHSFGALPAFAALRDGAGAPGVRMVAIAPVAEPEMTLRSFATALGLGPRATEELRRRFVRAIGADDAVFDRYSAVEHPLPVGIPLLLLHDPADRRVPAAQSIRLREAHPAAELRMLPGAGHSRILAADQTLDAVLEFATARAEVA